MLIYIHIKRNRGGENKSLSESDGLEEGRDKRVERKQKMREIFNFGLGVEIKREKKTGEALIKVNMHSRCKQVNKKMHQGGKCKSIYSISEKKETRARSQEKTREVANR